MGSEAVIYPRVSTDEQAVEGRGIQSQERELRKLAESKGIENPRVIRDEGASGRNLNREGLQKILGLVREGEVDRVMVVELDRLSRDMLDTFWILKVFRDHAVKLETRDGTIDYDDPINLLLAAVKAYASEEEVHNLVARTQGGKREKFREKKWIHSHVPFGYVKKDGWLAIDSGEAEIVREIFKTFIGCGGYADTARRINERFGNELDEELTRTQVKSILTNPVYVGRPSYGNDVEVKDDSLAVIDRETFDRVQKIVEEIASRYSRGEDDYLADKVQEYGLEHLENLVGVRPICRECGAPMVKSGSRTVRGVRVGKYRCSECGYQSTVPLGVQLAELEGRKLLSCPYCRVTENFDVNETLDGSGYKYRCRSCGGYFISSANPDKFLRDYPPENGGNQDE